MTQRYKATVLEYDGWSALGLSHIINKWLEHHPEIQIKVITQSSSVNANSDPTTFVTIFYEGTDPLGEVITTKHLIDLDAKPSTDCGSVKEHTKGGQFEFDPTKISLHLDEAQQNGGEIVGKKLYKKLNGLPIFNANLLDFYLAHPNLIPENWKGKWVFFWGTIYVYYPGGPYVRCLSWNRRHWRWEWHRLNLRDAFSGSHPAAVRISS